MAVAVALVEPPQKLGEGEIPRGNAPLLTLQLEPQGVQHERPLGVAQAEEVVDLAPGPTTAPGRTAGGSAWAGPTD